MNASKEKNSWLVRDSNNNIWGPISRTEILDLIKSKKLVNDTEISSSLSYWFQLSEKVELAKFFPELQSSIGVKAAANDTQATLVDLTKDTMPGEWFSDEYAEEFGFNEVDDNEGTIVAKLKKPAQEQVDTAHMLQDDEPTLVPEVGGDDATDPTLGVSGIIELRKQKARKMWFWCGGIIVAAILLGIFSIDKFLLDSGSPGNETNLDPGGRSAKNLTLSELLPRLKIALAFGDIGLLQDEISLIETFGKTASEEDRRIAERIVLIAKAVLKKEFLFDTAGAMTLLKTALEMGGISIKQRAEINNLIVAYRIESPSMQAPIELAESVVQALPGDEIAQFNLALAYLETGDKKKALHTLKVIESGLSPNSDLIPPLSLAIAIASTQQAPNYFKKALLNDPLNDKARILLALSQWYGGQMEAAKQNFRVYVDSLPGFTESLQVKNFRMGHVDPRYQKAREAVRAAIAKDRPGALLLSVDGILSILLGEFAEAEQSFDRALQRTPGNVYALKGLAYLRLKEGKELEIEGLIKDQAKENPKSFAFGALLGLSLMRQGKVEEAIEVYKITSQNYRKLSFVWSWLGEGYAGIKDDAKAIENFTKALRINPHDLVAQKGLMKMGKGNLVNTTALIPMLPF